MIISLNWVKEYLDLDKYSIEEIDKMISLHIIEIESLKKMVEATNLTIGHVLTCVEHPDSDHLHVCTVDLGTEVEQIVCGAPNVAAGQNVIVAKVGAVLPGDFKIKKGKIRGVESNGMICSLQELGFEEKYVPEEYKHGIYVIDKDAKPGMDPLKYLEIDDYLIELGLTPNRGDLMSVLGFVYDMGATVEQKVKYNAPIVKETNEVNPLDVEVKTDSCKEYNTRYIKDVVIKPSPLWMRIRLIASGIRPINNVVDITNYVLMELGQPLHSFDADKLGNKIVVRDAIEGETIVTLDGIKRDLVESDCVITDGVMPVCIGGVMGGDSTCVDDNTKNIVLEAAYFEPKAIRKTSSRLDLKSDSSVRYERKVDPNRVRLALDRAASLMEQYASGTVLNGVKCYDKLNKEDKKIQITLSYINKYLGTSLSLDDLLNIFDRLDFTYNIEEEIINLYVPTRRVDIETSQDITEEVARMYGYNNIPSTIPSTNDMGHLTSKQKNVRSIKAILEGLGLKETINYSLMNPKDKDLYTNGYGDYINLMMPLSEERSYVRQSLLNSLVEVAKYNSARKNSDLSLYELSKVYSKDKEVTLVSGLLMGYHSSSLWQGKKDNVDFYFVKGVLECLAAKTDIKFEYNKPLNPPQGFHPNKVAEVVYQNEVIGYVGCMHPIVEKNSDLNGAVLFELNITNIITREEKINRFVPINKYPSITRDIAIVCDKGVTAKQITDLIKQTAKKMLISLNIFDVYEGEKVGDNKKSIAISLVFQDAEKTLETSDVDKKVSSIIGRLERELNCTLRS